MFKILNCFFKFYNLIWIIEKFKSCKFTELRKLFNSTVFSKSINQIDQINFWQIWNSIIWIALVIFKYLLSINQITKLKLIIWIDCYSDTETFSNVIIFVDYTIFNLHWAYVESFKPCSKQPMLLRL